MLTSWRNRTIGVLAYTLAVLAVAWVNREALDYLDAWVKYAAVFGAPMLVFLGSFLLEKIHPRVQTGWKTTLARTFIVVICLATICLTFTALFVSFSAWMTPINNPQKYEVIIRRTDDSPFYAHFPRTIPADAQSVRFHFDPGALQAATILELGYTTTPERINALYREYAGKATLSFAAGTENVYIEPGNLIEDKTSFGTFPGDYTLFYLDEQPPTEEKDWNHPHCHGVAISKARSRIVYWAWSG